MVSGIQPITTPAIQPKRLTHVLWKCPDSMDKVDGTTEIQQLLPSLSMSVPTGLCTILNALAISHGELLSKHGLVPNLDVSATPTNHVARHVQENQSPTMISGELTFRGTPLKSIQSLIQLALLELREEVGAALNLVMWLGDVLSTTQISCRRMDSVEWLD